MKFSTREDIAAPIEDVFAALTEFDMLERAALRRGLEVTRTDTLTAPGPGMGWQVQFDFRGKHRVLNTELVHLTPPEVMGFKSEVGGLHGLTAVDLVPLSPGQTRMAVAVELAPHSVSARVFLQTLRLIKARLTRQFASAVTRFAREVEAGTFRK